MPAAIGLRHFGFDAAADGLRWVDALLGVGVAGYTAFLFAQCEGRDPWQSKLLLPHLLAQALFCGAAVLLPFIAEPRSLFALLIVGVAVHGFLARFERVRRHHTANARQAAAFLTAVRFGPIARPYLLSTTWGVWIPYLLALLAIRSPMPGLGVLTALVAIAGLYLYEHAFIRAGQLPPLS